MAELPIKYATYLDTNGNEQRTYLFNAEKAIYDEEGNNLKQKLIDMKNTIDTLQATITKLNSDLMNTKSYFWGGRTYASYRSATEVAKTISLPSKFTSYDVNNYFVIAVADHDGTSDSEKLPTIGKSTGSFSVYFNSNAGIFNTNSAIWFDYIVIVNH